VEQIRIAQQRLGLSTQQLLDKSKLSIDRSSLHRKLTGAVPTTDTECEALAKALGITLVWPKRRARKAATA
jgi:ribosome-binding protein aMBF1 (putative translation factor)